MGIRQCGGVSFLLWAMICLGPAIHVDVTLTRSKYERIAADCALS